MQGDCVYVEQGKRKRVKHMSRITMPRDVAGGLGLIIAATALAISQLWRMWKRRQWRFRQVPLTRQNVFLRAVGWKLFWMLFIAAALYGGPAFFYFGGAMDASGLAGSIALVTLVLAAVFVPGIRIWSGCLRLLRVCPLPQDESLLRIGGRWQYIDADWFILLCEGRCVVLNAGMINFTRPVRMRSLNSGTQLVFSGKNGKKIYALGELSKDVQTWIQEHK